MIKVEVLIPGNMKRFDIRCPQCQHIIQVDTLIGRTIGDIICWGCGALVKWEETNNDQKGL